MGLSVDSFVEPNPDLPPENSDEDNHYIVDDPVNYGAYNYGTNKASYFIKDVYPYWRYGNSEEDKNSTKWYRRVFGAGN